MESSKPRLGLLGRIQPGRKEARFIKWVLIPLILAYSIWIGIIISKTEEIRWQCTDGSERWQGTALIVDYRHIDIIVPTHGQLSGAVGQASPNETEWNKNFCSLVAELC